jgi:plastocyanin
MRRRSTAVATLAVLVAGGGSVLLAGGAQGQSAHAAKKTLHLRASASGALRFNHSKLTVSKPQTVTIVMANPSSSGHKHGIAVEGHGIDKDGKIVKPGKTTSVTVTIHKAGTYEFYCPFDDHKAMGMEGKLKVKSG